MELIDNKSIVNATLNLYQMVRVQFLPTPSKVHYVFNMRDVAKVFQGLTMIKPVSIPTPDNLVKLWIH
jgi:dynein heavy chain